ncbi:MAG: zf-TFIIB domain-containing protein [Deltaproteobacteria bacterium]|nr:zf-TFIIB domain-containing protein [Deltaproteobacteria bacterium]
MAMNRVTLKLKSERDSEEAYFKEQDEKLLRSLREKAAQEGDKQYREAHQDHCFRCGTKSLVEVDKGDTKIDICVNDGCGAVHLDPGELDEILKDNKSLFTIRKSILAVFK